MRDRDDNPGSQINPYNPIRIDVMDKRNSKENLLSHIKYLEDKLEKVYKIGQEGIAHVGKANYPHREREALSNLDAAYYDEIYED